MKEGREGWQRGSQSLSILEMGQETRTARKREHQGRLASPQPHGTTLTSPETGTQFSRTACGVACWAASETTGVR